MQVSEKSRVIFLFLLIIFLVGAGVLWLDYIGLISLPGAAGGIFKKEAESVLYAGDDEPSLMKLEEFEKNKEKLNERVENLDQREAMISEEEKRIQSDKEKINEMKSGIDLERKKLEAEKAKHSGYRKNIVDLAGKIESMPPEEAKEIMVKWDDPLIIDVLRQMDQNAAEQGARSITPYLISLMPKDKASRVMYLMTQL
jgi:flagellar protein FlbB